ncbi:MAG: hypothetical protein ABIP39_14545 [Polyangiaceae bacterium]
MRIKSVLVVASFALVVGPLGCAVQAQEETGDVGDTTSEALTVGCDLSRAEILGSVGAARAEAIRRGFTWYDARVPYSQTHSHAGYRTDCSGFVSMAWNLGQSFSTADFSTGGGESARLASYNSLVPADALVRRSNGEGHIVLFVGWNDTAHTAACVIEQESTALDMQFHARTTASLKSSGYHAIRADEF